MTRDVESRVTQTGINVCTFTVAVNNRKKKENSEGQDAVFFRVTAWRSKAELCAKYLKKGSKVCVIGAVSIQTYQTNKGETRSDLCVTMDDIEFLSRADTSSSAEDYSQAPEVPDSQQSTSNGYTDVTNDFNTDELPF